MATGVSSPPSITNLRERMLAATRMPFTPRGKAPGSITANDRMIARSAGNGRSVAVASVAMSITSFTAVLSLGRHARAALLFFLDRSEYLFGRGRQVGDTHTDRIVDRVHHGRDRRHHRG